MASPATRLPAPLVTLVRSRTVAKLDLIGLVVRRWVQCSAGKPKNASSSSSSSAIRLTTLGYFAPYTRSKSPTSLAACSLSYAW